MNNSKSGLVGIVSFLAIAAASLGFLGAARSAAAHDQPARPAPVAVVRDAAAPTVSFVVETDEVTVEGSAPAKRRAAAPAPVAIETSSDVCIVRALGDGNGTSVRTCTPVDMLVMRAR